MTRAVRQRVEDSKGPEATYADSEDFSCTCVLLLLDERPATADELCRRLRLLGLIEDDAEYARVELILLRLETDRLVHRATRSGETDLYTLATAGAEWLGIASDDLRSTQMLLDRFLARCGERLVR